MNSMSWVFHFSSVFEILHIADESELLAPMIQILSWKG